MLALIPVLRGLAARCGPPHIVDAIDALGCAVPPGPPETLDRAISLIIADETSRLGRALAIAACVLLTASVRLSLCCVLWLGVCVFLFFFCLFFFVCACV